MKTLLLILSLLLITTNAYADLPKEIKSNELKWIPFSEQKVAKDVYRAILKKKKIEDNEIYDELVAFVDLNYDKKDDVIVGLLSKPNDIRDRLSAKIINKEIDGYVLDSNAEIEFVVNHRDLKSEKNYPQILAKITMNRV